MTDDFQPFDVRGREKWVIKMMNAGYMELQAFRGHETYYNFDCLSCVYMTRKEASPTGYWCDKVNFPDAPHGCCNLYEPFPEVKKAQR